MCTAALGRAHGSRVARRYPRGGAPVIGVEPAFFIEAGVAQHDLTELIVCDTMGERKAKMIELGDAFVALPGGVGTLEEISEIFTRRAPRYGAARVLPIEYRRVLRPASLVSGIDGRAPLFRPVRPDRCHFPRSVEELARLLSTADTRRTIRCDGPLLQKAG